MGGSSHHSPDPGLPRRSSACCLRWARTASGQVGPLKLMGLAVHLDSMRTKIHYTDVKAQPQCDRSIRQELTAVETVDCPAAGKASTRKHIHSTRENKGLCRKPGRGSLYPSVLIRDTGAARLSSVKPATRLMLVLTPCRGFVQCFSSNQSSICHSGSKTLEAQGWSINCVNWAQHS